MSRIPTHTVEDAPAASQPLLQKIVQSIPMGRPANLHAQMAHSPAVLTAYTSLRAVLAEHTTFDPKVGAALTLAAAAGVGNNYMTRIASRLAQMNGWTEEQVTALTTGTSTNDAKIDVLAGLVRKRLPIRETLPTPPGKQLSSPAGTMSNWLTRLLIWEPRYSRHTSSTTHKPTWISERIKWSAEGHSFDLLGKG
ncbi:hypothetical protein [Rhizobium sp. RCAM05973]|uniref:hypothetical protein n=1 Tax=Rhizobium sp. RCAM05973 TaxID=2994066 RepID=UPI0022EBAE30|nr:hypothetical protein [Rhizobium sp. RCAM05973]